MVWEVDFWSSQLRKRRKAASGASTTSSPADSRGDMCFCSKASPAPARRPSRCSSCWPAPEPARSLVVHHPVRNRTRVAPGRRVPRLGAGRRIVVFELTPPESLLNAEQQQSLLYSSDLELGEATKQIFEVVERVKPTRVVLDSLSEIRLLAQSSLRYRRQILAIKHYFARYDATVLLLDDLTTESLRQDRAQRRPRRDSPGRTDAQLWRRTPSHPRGEISRRRSIAAASMTSPSRRRACTCSRAWWRPNIAVELPRQQLTSGIAEMDTLLGGGIETGSSTLILGPAGTGKSLIAMVFVAAAVAPGRKSGAVHFR